MGIIIDDSFAKIGIGLTEGNNPNLDNEKQILNEWKQILENRYLIKFIIVSNSSDYTTLQPENCLDIIRLKYGDKSKWIKIFVTKNLGKQLLNDSRFETEKKKTSFYWKSIIKDTDITKYFDVLDEAVKWLTTHN